MRAQSKKAKYKPDKPEVSSSSFTPEKRKKIIAQAHDLTFPLCEAEGIELVHIEYQREPGGRILRVYIDKPGGITLGDCSHISRQLSDLLDVYLDSEETYSLEVSSPGTDRPLGNKADFERFKGNMAKIRTHRPVDGQKNFSGILLGESDGMVKLSVNQKTVAIPYQDITKARLVNYQGENRC